MARMPKEERHAIVDAIVESSSDNMHILEMRIENIKRVRFAHIKPKGNTIVIAGKNGQGKTSVLDGVAWALTGTSMIPRYPIRKGQRTGSVKIDIGDFIITRQFTVVDEEKSTKDNTYLSKLVVTGKRGEAFPSPQVLLDRLLGKFGFDPMAFTRMEDDEQLAELRKLVTFDVDIDALDAQQKTDYDARREAGRVVDSLKNRVTAMAIPAPDLPLQPIDTAALTLKLQNAATHNSGVAAQRAEKKRLEDQSARLAADAAGLRERAAELRRQADELDAQAEEAVNNGSKSLAAASQVKIGTEIDTAAVAEELTRANETNRSIQAAAYYRQLEKELDAADEAWAAIDKRMKERDTEREKAIERAKMPIEKLSIGHGEVVYNGLPLNQASNAEQIRVSMALGMAANPKLRLLCIRDGSLLDADSLKLIDELAEANKFQVLMERVETDGKVSVIMEDGEASGDDVEAENVKP